MPIRAAQRQAHFRYLDEHQDILVLGGAMLADDGTTRIGGVLIINVPNRQEANSSANEPFRQAGLFARVEITHMRRGSGTQDKCPHAVREGN